VWWRCGTRSTRSGTPGHRHTRHLQHRGSAPLSTGAGPARCRGALRCHRGYLRANSPCTNPTRGGRAPHGIYGQATIGVSVFTDHRHPRPHISAHMGAQSRTSATARPRNTDRRVPSRRADFCELSRALLSTQPDPHRPTGACNTGPHHPSQPDMGGRLRSLAVV
jgi:hypothetical protein